jgi:hypothetical protein
MMEAEMVSETLGSCPQLTGLVAREDFIEIYTNLNVGPKLNERAMSLIKKKLKRK